MSKVYLFAVMLLAASLTGCIEGGEELEKSTSPDEEEEDETIEPVGQAEDNETNQPPLVTAGIWMDDDDFIWSDDEIKQENKYTLRPRSKRSIKAGLAAAGAAGVAGAGKAGGGESVTPSSGVGDSSALLPGGGESIASSGGGPGTLPGGGEPGTLPGGGGARGGESTKSNASTRSITSGGKTTGLRTTLGLMKSAFTLALVVVVITMGADVYKMYDGGITINLEDHITSANFWLTPDEESIVGNISFDIPKMGYFEKSIDVQVHLKIMESDPTTEDDFNFDYTLGSGNQTYEEFELNDLDPVTKDKIDKEEPLDIEYTITITIVYLGVELGPTASEIGTKVTTVQTVSES